MRRNRGRLIIMAMACSATLGLSACATRPVGLLMPGIAADQAAHAIDMLVVSNRQPTDQPGVVYSAKRSREISAQDIVVGIPPDANRQKGQIQWPLSLPANPKKDFLTESIASLDTAGALKWLSEKVPAHDGDLIIFVPGYNTPFDRGVYLFAQVVYDSDMKATPVLFAWPSQGRLFGYNYDRESATYSRTGLADLLEHAANNPDVKHISILAHSMGGWLTMEALRTGALRGDDYQGKLQSVVLASPDIDVDVFYAQMQDLSVNPPDITLIISRDDKALRLARRIGGNIDRLGAVDLTKEPYKSEAATSKLHIVDVSGVKVDDQSDHLKFAENPDLARLIGQSLAQGQKLSVGQSSFYEDLGISILSGGQTVTSTIGKLQGRSQGSADVEKASRANTQ